MAIAASLANSCGRKGVSVEAGVFSTMIGGLNPSTLPTAEFQIVASCTQVAHPGQIGMSFPIRTSLKSVRQATE